MRLKSAGLATEKNKYSEDKLHMVVCLPPLCMLFWRYSVNLASSKVISLAVACTNLLTHKNREGSMVRGREGCQGVWHDGKVGQDEYEGIDFES